MKTYLFAFLILFSTGASAQNSFSGQKMLALSGGASFSKLQDQIGLTGRFGYFVNDEVALGGQFEFLSMSSHTPGWYSTNIMSYAAGPFVRLYLPSAHVAPFLGGEASYGVVKLSGAGETESEQAIFIGPELGLNFFVTSALSFELLTSYQYVNYINIPRAEQALGNVFLIELGMNFFW